MTQSHQDITVEQKRICTQEGFVRKSGCWYSDDMCMDDHHIPVESDFCQMMMMHVDMLRHGILCQRYCTLVALKNLHAWYAVSRKSKTRLVCNKKSHSDMAECLASVVESVTHSCVRQTSLLLRLHTSLLLQTLTSDRFLHWHHPHRQSIESNPEPR